MVKNHWVDLRTGKPFTPDLEQFGFVYIITNLKTEKKYIGCLEEIALKNKWISKKHIISSIKFYGNCDYSNYLKKLIN